MCFDLQEFIGNTGLHLPEDGTLGRRATSFAAGSNLPQDIFGFASVGIPPALDADQLVARNGEFPEGVAAVTRLAGTGMPVLLKSGAFREHLTGVPVDATEWRLRLDLYERMADDFGRQLYVMAPDKVDDQAESLARLQIYGFDMHLIALAGANVLLTMGKGEMAHTEYQSVAEEIIGAKVIPTFSMHDGLTSHQDVIDFVQATQPEKVHLMGLRDGAEARHLIATLWDIQPDMMVSKDACLLRSEDLHETYESTCSMSKSLLWDNVEPVADPVEAQAALKDFANSWRGWLIHQSFANSDLAHQYSNVEDQFLAELGAHPDMGSKDFAQGLRDFRALNNIPEPTHSC